MPAVNRQRAPNGNYHGSLELAADLNTGVRHAVVRPIAEIGVGRMGNLGDHVPVLVEALAGTRGFPKEESTAEVRAIRVAFELPIVPDAAEAAVAATKNASDEHPTTFRNSIAIQIPSSD